VLNNTLQNSVKLHRRTVHQVSMCLLPCLWHQILTAVSFGFLHTTHTSSSIVWYILPLQQNTLTQLGNIMLSIHIFHTKHNNRTAARLRKERNLWLLNSVKPLLGYSNLSSLSRQDAVVLRRLRSASVILALRIYICWIDKINQNVLTVTVR